MERDHYERYLMNVMLTARLLPLLLTVVCLPAALAEYPDHPIRYIVPSAAGNGADISARMLTAELANQMKAQFVIDNRPTAGGVIGVGMLARAPADGYTLGYANMVYLSIFPALMSNLPYDIDREIQVVGRFTSGQNLLAVRNTLPVKTVADLVNYARANPDKLTFGSSGNGTTLHLSGELFKQMTGTRIVHVPYKAVQQALTEIIAGQVDLIFDNQPSIAPYAKADASGEPLFRLPAAPGHRVPFLSYASGAYLGQMVEAITRLAPAPLNLESIYETDMAEGLKAMAIEGHGLAFLPTNSVARELNAGRLVRAAPPGQHELTMEIRIYRERPEVARHAKAGAVALWQFLREGAAAGSAPAAA